MIQGYVSISIPKVMEYKEFLPVIFLPVAYVLGIYVDVVSSFFISRFGAFYRWLHEFPSICFMSYYLAAWLSMFLGSPKKDPYERSASILSYSVVDLIRTMDSYVSRDRIARGMALNSLVGGVVSNTLLPEDVRIEVSILCSVIFLLSVMVWFRLRRLSKSFKRLALSKLESKNISPL
jgi:hypothetical protein